jgi:hypothetical protein
VKKPAKKTAKKTVKKAAKGKGHDLPGVHPTLELLDSAKIITLAKMGPEEKEVVAALTASEIKALLSIYAKLAPVAHPKPGWRAFCF